MAIHRSFGLALIAALICATLATAFVWRVMRQQMTAIRNEVTPPLTVGAGAFTRLWSTDSPGLVLGLAPAPGGSGGFYVLAGGYISLFDADGRRQSRFEAPPKAQRIATDTRGAIPFIAVVSSRTKWTGAIDHVVTTDYFLHLYDPAGRELWIERFDPKEVATLEPLVTMLDGRPAIVLSASKRIVCFGIDGTRIWDVALWHHPGTLADGHQDDGGPGFLVAARAPGAEIVRIDNRGAVIGPWAVSDGPRRLATVVAPGGGIAGISLRPVYGRGQGGVQHLLTFFEGGGAALNESELPPSATPLSYSPIAAVDGPRGPYWLLAFGDGSLRAFSLQGRSLVTHETGVRFTTYSAIPGRSLLVTAVQRGLIGWRLPTIF